MAKQKSGKLAAVFFKTNYGKEPVREWLKRLPKCDRYLIGVDIQTVQYGWPLGMPLVDGLGDGLWEVRSRLHGGRIARVLFFMDDGAMILVNGFVKKTQKTPVDEIKLALKRKKSYQRFKKQ